MERPLQSWYGGGSVTVANDRWDGGFLNSLSQAAQESPISQQLSWPHTLAVLAALAIAAGQKPTGSGDRQFRGARSAKQDAGVCKASLINRTLRLGQTCTGP